MVESAGSLPDVRHLLVVCAHPYDATFAMGAIVSAFTGARTTVDVLCLTHGRRHDQGSGRRLARAQDLGEAARALGVREFTFLEHEAGALAEAPLEHLTDEIVMAADAADALLVVDARDPGAHPDHVRTLQATAEAAEVLDDPLYGWSLRPPRSAGPAVTVEVDRDHQRDAIACHRDLPAEDPIRERWRAHLEPREYLAVLRSERARRPRDTRKPLTRTSRRR
ncbi:PIG-L deacetylase family protein [Myceligenerans xiligouense]|uniref:LmbE family N-acetylglucosaminyl deacetylase n=1 Tax=Myceligenerans xiligouense TaxID=253184 RepID=A0A3N4ZKR1_9MICO|nr:PIG-L family deacetylase [Myceligenerans xiligouense]RPF20511.1 LmbE family N-acetylglucosaminyl deacetylase [Myceligenerans xiligouense]